MPAMDFASALGKNYSEMVSRGILPKCPSIEEIEGTAYAIYKSQGVSLIIDQLGMIGTVQFYGAETEDVAKFAGEPINGVSLSMGRHEVRAALGTPTLSKDAPFRTPFLGLHPPWDRWTQPGMSIHAEYNCNVSSIRLLSLMS